MNEVRDFMGIDRCFLFGFFENSEQAFESEEDKHLNESFESFQNYRNTISKEKIIDHISSLEPYCLRAGTSVDRFTNMRIKEAGYYKDSEFVFPVEFLHYYENYDIGIPYEYEDYLKTLFLKSWIYDSEIRRY